MAYTDKFFRFPVKAYNPYSMINAALEEEKGLAKGDVVENGFTCSVISILEGDEVEMYECVWTTKRFLKELDEFMEKKLK
jgi:hypothetical protein